MEAEVRLCHRGDTFVCLDQSIYSRNAFKDVKVVEIFYMRSDADDDDAQACHSDFFEHADKDSQGDEPSSMLLWCIDDAFHGLSRQMSSSSTPAIEIDAGYAKSLGISMRTIVWMQPASPAKLDIHMLPAPSITLETCNETDWEFVQQHSGELSRCFVNQVRVIRKGGKIPIHVADKTVWLEAVNVGDTGREYVLVASDLTELMIGPSQSKATLRHLREMLTPPGSNEQLTVIQKARFISRLGQDRDNSPSAYVYVSPRDALANAWHSYVTVARVCPLDSFDLLTTANSPVHYIDDQSRAMSNNMAILVADPNVREGQVLLGSLLANSLKIPAGAWVNILETRCQQRIASRLTVNVTAYALSAPSKEEIIAALFGVKVDNAAAPIALPKTFAIKINGTQCAVELVCGDGMNSTEVILATKEEYINKAEFAITAIKHRTSLPHKHRTKISGQLFDLLKDLQPVGRLIYGESGVGKTCAIQHAVARIDATCVYYSFEELSFEDPVTAHAQMQVFDLLIGDLRKLAGLKLVVFDHVERLLKLVDLSDHSNPEDPLLTRIIDKLARAFVKMIYRLERLGCGWVMVTTAAKAINPCILERLWLAETCLVEKPDPIERKEIIALLLRELGATPEPADTSNWIDGLGPMLPIDIEYAVHDFVSRLEGSGNLPPFIPASMRGESRTRVSYSDIGGLDAAKKTLEQVLLWPIRFEAIYLANRIPRHAGVLLYGKPGCGKTMLAAGFAQKAKAAFLLVKGPELLGKYVGASERGIRELFEKARRLRPSIIFFDELDALAPHRGHDNTGVTDRVVNQLLTELDGTEDRSGVFVIAASSRPDLIDTALMRPGRIDVKILIDLPNARERKDILVKLGRNLGMKEPPDRLFDMVGEKTSGYSGADLRAVLQNAQLASIRDALAKACAGEGVVDRSLVTEKHVEEALAIVKPSTNDGQTFNASEKSRLRPRATLA